jgi:hypothetical protein
MSFATTPRMKGRTRARRLRPGALTTLALLALAAAACNGNGPTSPSNAVVYQGTILYRGSAIHPVSVGHTGLMEVTLSELRPVLIDTTSFDPASIRLGFAIGTPDGADCKKTGNITLAKGGTATFYLNHDDYCLDLFDVGLIPQDGILAYTLSVRLPK